MWYGEASYFAGSYGKSNPSGSGGQAGHFTQLIWKGSTQVGCYTQICKAGTLYDSMDSVFTVCNYFPAGMCLERLRA